MQGIFSRSASEEALARMGWRSVPGRPKPVECRQVVEPNRSFAAPTPSLWLHGAGCKCGEEAAAAASEGNQRKEEDETMALKIFAASEVHRGRGKSNRISLLQPSAAATKSKRRRSGIISIYGMARLFQSSPPPSPAPSKTAKVADLCAACSDLDIDRVARCLFEDDAPINAHDAAGTTPLMAAVHAAGRAARPKAHLAMITFLLDCGADPNATTAAHVRPGTQASSILTAACTLGLPDVVKLLLDRGAAVGAPLPPAAKPRSGHRGMTALHVATLAAQPDCVAMLLAHGGANVTTTMDACKPAHLGPQLASAAASPNASTTSLDKKKFGESDRKQWTKGVTALHLAHDNYACAGVLLRHGADPAARDAYGRTPLHWAVDAGNADVVALLLANNRADTYADAADAEGVTPLAMLVARIEAGAGRPSDPDTARALLENGADADLRIPYGIHKRTTLRRRLLKLDRGRRVYEPILALFPCREDDLSSDKGSSRASTRGSLR